MRSRGSRRRGATQSWSRPLPPECRIEGVANAVAEEVEAERDDEDRQAGDDRHPPIIEQVIPPLGHHRSPFRRWRLRSESEEAEHRGEQDRVTEIERALNDRGRKRVRKNVRTHDAQVTLVEGACEADVVELGY